jgi:acyl carrier protein
LVSFIETEFNIQIGEDEIIPENLDSIVNITTFVKKKRSS